MHAQQHLASVVDARTKRAPATPQILIGIVAASAPAANAGGCSPAEVAVTCRFGVASRLRHSDARPSLQSCCRHGYTPPPTCFLSAVRQRSWIACGVGPWQGADVGNN